MDEKNQPQADPEFERANRKGSFASSIGRIPLWAKVTVTLLILFVGGLGYMKRFYPANSLNQSATTHEQSDSDLDEGQAQDRGKAMDGEFVTNDGKPTSLANFKDKVTVVTFWASWCTPCIVELPTFSKVKQELGSKGLEVVAINLDDEESAAKEFIQENWNPAKMAFDPFFDPKRVMMKNFNVETIPSTFVLDRKGRIAMSAVGSQDWGDPRILDNIRQIVNEK
jgi:thiol-disulfide isomerase/thioredoxin